jgi:hypothetical protein
MRLCPWTRLQRSGLEAVARKRGACVLPIFHQFINLQDAACNKCLMIGTECIFCIVGVKGFRGWQSFSTGQQGFGRHLGFLALIDCSFLWCFQHTFVCLKCEKEVGLKLWSEATADSRDSVAGCSASQRVSSLIRSSQRDRPPSFDKWVVVRSYRFRSWVIASEPRTLS